MGQCWDSLCQYVWISVSNTYRAVSVPFYEYSTKSTPRLYIGIVCYLTLGLWAFTNVWRDRLQLYKSIWTDEKWTTYIEPVRRIMPLLQVRVDNYLGTFRPLGLLQVSWNAFYNNAIIIWSVKIKYLVLPVEAKIIVTRAECSPRTAWPDALLRDEGMLRKCNMEMNSGLKSKWK